MYEGVRQYQRGLRERFGNRKIARSWGESLVSKRVFLFLSHVAEGQATKQETEKA